MSVQDKVIAAAERLILVKPYDQITYAEIAKEAGVHWTAVKRHLGDKQLMRAWLAGMQADLPDHDLADTRTRIIEAGVNMFSELGFTQASLDLVASRAGVTKGAVYWHFANKQDLFLAVLDRHFTLQLDQLPNEIDQILSVSDPRAAIARWFEEQLALLANGGVNPMLFLEFVTSSREPDIRTMLQTVHGKILDGTAALLKGMQQRGMIHGAVDPQALSTIIDALLKGLAVEWIIDPERCESRSRALPQILASMLWAVLSP